MDANNGMVDTSPPNGRQMREDTGFGSLTKYDVFLNHRGPDVKKTFASHLNKALRQAGCNPFLDAKALVTGVPIFDSINEALNGVHVHIAIFSPRYAESKNCLNELCDMLASGKPVIPVFYDVKPEDLRWTDFGPFAEAFLKHLKRGRDADVRRWKGALLQAAAKAGILLADCNNDTVKLEEEIVAAVLKALPAQAATTASQIQQVRKQRLPKQEQGVQEQHSFLKLAKECVEKVEKMPSRNFNNDQCCYLVDKLKVVIQSASLFSEELCAIDRQPCSSVDFARHVENLKFLLVLANQVKSFVQGCSKSAWVQAAMTLTNAADHVSSIGSNLELCRVAFCKECARTESLTLDQVVEIDNVEVAIVKEKAYADVETLLARVKSELSSMRGGKRSLAAYVLHRLSRVQANNGSFTSESSFSAVHEESFWGRLFKWCECFNPHNRLGAVNITFLIRLLSMFLIA